MKFQVFVAAWCLLVPGKTNLQATLNQTKHQMAAALITVRVFNYASVSVRDLSLAQSTTENIFRNSGVEIIWYDCGPSMKADGDPNCSGSTCLTTFNLRLCKSCTAFLKGPGHEVQGFATGETATVSATWASQLPMSTYVSSELVLGRVIAHELGHILLGPGHSVAGIMKGRWTEEDIEPGKLGMLTFTEQQGKQMRSVLKSRVSSLIIEKSCSSPAQ